MILQKSCHDMDILTWLLGKKCKALSSFGSTRLFKPECAPEGAALRCLDGCKAKEKCLFDAEKIYITSPKTGLATGSSWMSSVLSVENTMESTYTTKQGDVWDKIAYEVYGDEEYTGWLMENNFPLLDTFVFDAGVVLQTPAPPEQTAANDLPIWRSKV